MKKREVKPTDACVYTFLDLTQVNVKTKWETTRNG